MLLGMTLAIKRSLERRVLNDTRKIFTINRRLFCPGHSAAWLLSQPLLVFVYRLCRDQPDPVRVYELVPDDGFPEKAQSQGRREASSEQSLNTYWRFLRSQANQHRPTSKVPMTERDPE
jgi:hypothetical protein